MVGTSQKNPLGRSPVKSPGASSGQTGRASREPRQGRRGVQFLATPSTPLSAGRGGRVLRFCQNFCERGVRARESWAGQHRIGRPGGFAPRPLGFIAFVPEFGLDWGSEWVSLPTKSRPLGRRSGRIPCVALSSARPPAVYAESDEPTRHRIEGIEGRGPKNAARMPPDQRSDMGVTVSSTRKSTKFKRGYILDGPKSP